MPNPRFFLLLLYRYKEEAGVSDEGRDEVKIMRKVMTAVLRTES